MDEKLELENGELFDYSFSDNTETDSAELNYSLPFEDKRSGVRYMNWPDVDHGGFRYTDIVLRIMNDDTCTMTWVIKQKHKFYTHTRNRRIWTGPYFSLTMLDRGKVPVGEVISFGQVNRICTQRDERIIKTFKVTGAYALVSTATFTRSSYRSWNC